MIRMIPRYIKQYFWGDNLTELDWEKHKDYIAKTILEKGNSKAIRWLFRKTDKGYLRGIVEDKVNDPKSKNFWNIYLS